MSSTSELGINLKNHFLLTNSENTAQIINSTLNAIGLQYFTYIRVFHKNGKRILLSNRPDWIEYFYNNALFSTPVITSAEFFKERICYRWENYMHDQAFADGRKGYNIHDGISLIYKEEAFTHIYCFGGDESCTAAIIRCQENREILEKLRLYWHFQGEELIKKSMKHLITIPDLTYKKQLEKKRIFNAREMDLIDLAPINKVYLNADIYASQAEINCVIELLHGNSSKKTAKKYNISPRTVELHLAHIKNKLHCKNSAELIYKLSKTGLYEILINSKL